MAFEYNTDIVTRDQLIYGKYDPSVYANEQNELPAWVDLNHEALNYLVELKYINPNGSHEGSPKYKDFISFLERHPDYVGIGTITSSRMVIDGVIKYGPVTTMEEIEDLQTTFPDPDEVRIDAPWDEDGNEIADPRVIVYYSHI